MNILKKALADFDAKAFLFICIEYSGELSIEFVFLYEVRLLLVETE